MNVRCIIVPLDESVLAEAALPYAETLAAGAGAALRLISVVETEPAGLVGGLPEVRAYLERSAEEAREQYLHRTVAALADRGLQATTRVLRGDPVDEILAAADEEADSVIVMATHGRGGMERWLVGSVADKVMRMSTRPVLLVRPREDGELADVTLRRVMAPLDGSELSEQALPLATVIARTCGATLVLVRVEPWLAATVPVYGYLPDLGRMDADAAVAAEQYLEDVRRGLPADLTVRTAVLRGAPADALIGFTRRERIDLTVMGTHGAGGFRRFVLGSTADRMIRSGLPVLLHRVTVPEQDVWHPASATPHAVETPATTARRCSLCGRLVTWAARDDDRCPRCRTHLHACHNCVFWDQFACVLQRPEAHDRAWAGHGCPRFTHRETPGTATVLQKA